MGTKFAVPEIKIDLKAEATKALCAYAGASDLAMEYVRGAVADAGKKAGEAQTETREAVEQAADEARKGIAGVDLAPPALIGKATGVVTGALAGIAKELKSRRAFSKACRAGSMQNKYMTTATEAIRSAVNMGFCWEDVISRTSFRGRCTPRRTSAGAVRRTTTTHPGGTNECADSARGSPASSRP